MTGKAHLPRDPAPGRRVRQRLGALVVAATLLLCAPVVLAGCTAARNTLGTRVGVCYHALPVAAAAVHHRGKFAGVRLVGAGDLRALGRLGDMVRGSALPSLCVVGFRGSFTSAQVVDPVGAAVTAPRPYAVVVVTAPGDRLVGTAVLRRLPLALRDLV